LDILSQGDEMVADKDVTKPKEKRQLVGVRKEDLDRLRRSAPSL